MRRAPLAVVAAGVVLVVGAGPMLGSHRSLPASAPAPGASGSDQLVNDEVVLAELDPTGLPERAVLLSRITVEGPPREVIDPASGTNVRYLDRLGRPEVDPDGVVLVVGGERPTVLTEARFDQPLPVAVHAQYEVDGLVVPATQIPGAAGRVAVTYTLTNTTAQVEELTYTDAAGVAQSTDEPVFIPFQGTLTATLPEDTDLVEAPGAMLATDTQGRTVARWNVALFPPLSTPIQQLSLTVDSQRAGVPAVDVLLTPAGAGQDPATDFSSDLLASSTGSSSELYDGLVGLDTATGELASGSARFADGMAGLAQGANQAEDASQVLTRGISTLAGGADAAADASGTLADGVGGLAVGADEVATGAQELAGALGSAAAGARDLAEATAQLAEATAGSPAAALGPLIEGGAQIEAGLLETARRIGSPADPVLDLTDPLPEGDGACPPGGTAPPDADCVTIYQGVRALRDGLQAIDAVIDALGGSVDQARQAFAALIADLSSIGEDVTAAAAGARELYESLCTDTPPALDASSCAQLEEVAEAAEAALGTAQDALPDVEELLAAIAVVEQGATAVATAVATALASTEQLLAGVAAVGLAVGTGTPSSPGLATAMAALNAGLAELSDQLVASQEQLDEAVNGLAAGSQELATGIDGTAQGAGSLADGSTLLGEGAQEAASGADALAAGSRDLAEGTGAAASGAAELSTGLDGLAQGTDAAASAGQGLAEGAAALRADGTQPATQAVLDGSTPPALARAWLGATTSRAQDALPYGPPAGAQGHVAYVFTMAEVPAPRSLWERIRAVFGR